MLDALVAAGRTLRGASPPPLDLGIALGRVGGNRELLAELAQLFVEDYPAKIADVRASLDAKDARRGQRVVHHVKGGLATLGATALQETAARLESRFEEQRLAEAEPLVAELAQGPRGLVACLRTTELGGLIAPAAS